MVGQPPNGKKGRGRRSTQGYFVCSVERRGGGYYMLWWGFGGGARLVGGQSNEKEGLRLFFFWLVEWPLFY